MTSKILPIFVVAAIFATLTGCFGSPELHPHLSCNASESYPETWETGEVIFNFSLDTKLMLFTKTKTMVLGKSIKTSTSERIFSPTGVWNLATDEKTPMMAKDETRIKAIEKTGPNSLKVDLYMNDRNGNEQRRRMSCLAKHSLD